MTARVFLLRHAAHDTVGSGLAGRAPGITLGPDGLAQAGRLARRMAGQTLAAIYASPRERTRQTADAVAEGRSLDVTIASELDEIDFGRWSGNTFDTLNQDPLWRQWNAARSVARTPGGESVLDVQRRVVGLIERAATAHAGHAIALVSHADVIKAAVSYHLGLPVDAWQRFDIAPASVTVIDVGDWGARLLTLNEEVPP